jgi:hypothetical protein
VCQALREALARHGVPGQILTDIQDGLRHGMPCIVRPVV